MKTAQGPDDSAPPGAGDGHVPASAAALDEADQDDSAFEDDRRAAGRTRTVYRVAKVVRDKAVGLWRVRNISDRGMMLRTGVPVISGERLAIALSDSVEMDGRVVWCQDGHCGVEFDQPIDSAGVLKSLAAERDDPGYRAPRLPVDMRAVAYCEHGIHSVRITDVSRQGVGFIHDGAFHPGMQVMILMEDGHERRGIVRWSHEDHAGMLLVEPISEPELEVAGLLPAPGTDTVEHSEGVTALT